VEDLQSGVLQLARDPQLRQRLGAAARLRLHEQGLFWEENARRVEELVASARGLQGEEVVMRNREVRSC
jgi:glycosyltransferase involved in cell wall biosynthesis